MDDTIFRFWWAPREREALEKSAPLGEGLDTEQPRRSHDVTLRTITFDMPWAMRAALLGLGVGSKYPAGSLGGDSVCRALYGTAAQPDSPRLFRGAFQPKGPSRLQRPETLRSLSPVPEGRRTTGLLRCVFWSV